MKKEDMVKVFTQEATRAIIPVIELAIENDHKDLRKKIEEIFVPNFVGRYIDGCIEGSVNHYKNHKLTEKEAKTEEYNLINEKIIKLNKAIESVLELLK
jgi:hypothetical protein